MKKLLLALPLILVAFTTQATESSHEDCMALAEINFMSETWKSEGKSKEWTTEIIVHSYPQYNRSNLEMHISFIYLSGPISEHMIALDYLNTKTVCDAKL